MSTYVEFVEKSQDEFLKSLQAAQDLNVETIGAFTNLLAQAPSPVDFVQRSFAFTNQILETRKAYALRLAQLANEALRKN